MFSPIHHSTYGLAASFLIVRLLMESARIAQILDEMGTILEIQGENPFRCRAYHNAAQVLSSLPADLSEMIADGTLADVPGIGETMHKSKKEKRAKK